ncbi:hypothetical protein AHA02nite_16580 [Alkalibacillus haloalkaliphilus]|uniref:Uncharacterized protein n=1 Tax=Alkalibacillus haloalkaliphilus TaxID=94136 RepID=A0A511W965_9BACI|nr:hypothetical protein AHA02nite_16580 [Alkalibacillus haloalkaliphilus]
MTMVITMMVVVVVSSVMVSSMVVMIESMTPDHILPLLFTFYYIL